MAKSSRVVTFDMWVRFWFIIFFLGCINEINHLDVLETPNDSFWQSYLGPKMLMRGWDICHFFYFLSSFFILSNVFSCALKSYLFLSCKPSEIFFRDKLLNLWGGRQSGELNSWLLTINENYCFFHLLVGFNWVVDSTLLLVDSSQFICGFKCKSPFLFLSYNSPNFS